MAKVVAAVALEVINQAGPGQAPAGPELFAGGAGVDAPNGAGGNGGRNTGGGGGGTGYGMNTDPIFSNIWS